MSGKGFLLGTLLLIIALPVLLLLLATGYYYGTFYVSERANGTLVSGGREREYLLHIPASYDAARPRPGSCSRIRCCGRMCASLPI